MLNRIITRGLGTSRGAPGIAGLVTMGYGGIAVVPPFPSGTAPRRIGGQFGTKRRLQELERLEPIVVWARMVETNGTEPTRDIKGAHAQEKDVHHLRTIVEHVSSRVVSSWEYWKVTAKRIHER